MHIYYHSTQNYPNATKNTQLATNQKYTTNHNKKIFYITRIDNMYHAEKKQLTIIKINLK